MKKRGAFFYILIVLALLAVAALIFVLAPGNEPETPAVLLPPAATSDASGSGSTGPAEVQQTIAVTPDTVQTALETLHRAESYSRTLTVERFWTGGSSRETVSVWADGENLRLAVQTEGSEAVKNVLLSGREKLIWYSDREGVFRGAVREGDEDAYQSILTYEDVLSLDQRNITDAGFTDYDGVNCIFVRYVTGEFLYDNLCYVAVDTGLLMGQETYDGDILIYSMHSDVPDLSVPDNAVFAVS